MDGDVSAESLAALGVPFSVVSGTGELGEGDRTGAVFVF